MSTPPNFCDIIHNSLQKRKLCKNYNRPAWKKPLYGCRPRHCDPFYDQYPELIDGLSSYFACDPDCCDCPCYKLVPTRRKCKKPKRKKIVSTVQPDSVFQPEASLFKPVAYIPSPISIKPGNVYLHKPSDSCPKRDRCCQPNPCCQQYIPQYGSCPLQSYCPSKWPQGCKTQVSTNSHTCTPNSPCIINACNYQPTTTPSEKNYHNTPSEDSLIAYPKSNPHIVERRSLSPQASANPSQGRFPPNMVYKPQNYLGVQVPVQSKPAQTPSVPSIVREASPAVPGPSNLGVKVSRKRSSVQFNNPEKSSTSVLPSPSSSERDFSEFPPRPETEPGIPAPPPRRHNNSRQDLVKHPTQSEMPPPLPPRPSPSRIKHFNTPHPSSPTVTPPMQISSPVALKRSEDSAQEKFPSKPPSLDNWPKEQSIPEPQAYAPPTARPPRYPPKRMPPVYPQRAPEGHPEGIPQNIPKGPRPYATQYFPQALPQTPFQPWQPAKTPPLQQNRWCPRPPPIRCHPQQCPCCLHSCDNFIIDGFQQCCPSPCDSNQSSEACGPLENNLEEEDSVERICQLTKDLYKQFTAGGFGVKVDGAEINPKKGCKELFVLAKAPSSARPKVKLKPNVCRIKPFLGKDTFMIANHAYATFKNHRWRPSVYNTRGHRK